MKTVYRKENGKIVGVNADDKKAQRMIARGWSESREALAGGQADEAPKKRGRKKKDASSVD